MQGSSQEFIEIYNPTAQAIDLGNYYLTDATYWNDDDQLYQYYWQIAEGNPGQTTVGGGDFWDFHARFPQGFAIAAGDSISIAVGGSEAFAESYGFLPHLELYEDGEVADDVPDMVPVFQNPPGDLPGNSIITLGRDSDAGVPGLSNGAEGVILYLWNGDTNLVTDIDVFVWRNTGTSTSFMFSKTGVEVGGDTYQPETAIDDQDVFPTAHAFGESYARIDPYEGTQVTGGSNGVDGRDEVSENWTGTFASRASSPAVGSGAPVNKMLLSEVCAAAGGQEFIEIYNPSDGAVDLSAYYLTDAVDGPTQKYYWRIAEGTPTRATVGGGADNDFHARFPDGFRIEAGDTISVSIAGSEAYLAEWGLLPDLELFEDGDEADGVPDMVPVFLTQNGDSIVDETAPALDETGEVAVFYYWDGESDLVTDVDLMLWGSGTEYRFSKTGVTVGSSTYQNETAVDAQDPLVASHEAGESFTRTDDSEGDQVSSGSNGVDGRDEVSENWSGTFAVEPASPGGSPPVAPTVAVKLLISQVCTQWSDAEYIEIYNPGDTVVDMSQYYLTDALYAPNSQYYWNITQGNLSSETVGGGAFQDFHAQFPAGFELAAGDSVAIAIAGSAAFFNTYGYLPGLVLFDDGQGMGDVPAMRPIFGSIGGDNSIISEDSTPGLSNAGEPAILYHWDGIHDLVTDIDVFLWRDASASDSFMFSKNNVSVGDSTYAAETLVPDQAPFPEQHNAGEAYVRSDASEGDQTSTGSNGVDGRDELSEEWGSTFSLEAAQPSRPDESGEGNIGNTVILSVPARTFVPTAGDKFPIDVVTKSNSESKLRVFDLEGRLVIALYDSRYDGRLSINPQSPSRMYWDGRDATYERVSGGMYVLHMSVINKDTGEEEIKTAPVVVATRF